MPHREEGEGMSSLVTASPAASVGLPRSPGGGLGSQGGSADPAGHPLSSSKQQGRGRGDAKQGML